MTYCIVGYALVNLNILKMKIHFRLALNFLKLLISNDNVFESLKIDFPFFGSAWFLCIKSSINFFPAGSYMFNVNIRNTITRREILSKLIMKTLERRRQRRSGVFIVDFEHISHLVLVFLLLTLSR